jgi:hypothetical protein
MPHEHHDGTFGFHHRDPPAQRSQLQLEPSLPAPLRLWVT